MTLRLSPVRLLLASLVHHRWLHLPVILGVAAGTAVLTGALLMGDSLRGSLRQLTFARLGRVDEALLAPRFFRAALADELGRQPGVAERFAAVVPVIMLSASVERPPGAGQGRVNRVKLIGCDERFWAIGPAGTPRRLGPREVAINRPVAEALRVKPGEDVIVRFALPESAPAETPLGRKLDTLTALRLRVGAVLEAEGLGRFSLEAAQRIPRLAYVPLETLQQALDRPGQVNTLLAVGKRAETWPSPQDHEVLQAALRPRAVDYGIQVSRTPRGYFQITTDRLLFSPALAEGVMQALSGERFQPAFTYLATSIACGEREIPYSTITAVDFATEPPLGPMVAEDGTVLSTPGPNQIVLNSWAAERLGVPLAAPRSGRSAQSVRVRFFAPENLHGHIQEDSAQFELVAVAALREAAADRHWTPEVRGVTDQRTIEDWDPPFPFESKRIQKSDEEYWELHGATPKAFVSLATGQRLWGSRFGALTTVRVAPREGFDLARLESGADFSPEKLGFVFTPVKRLGLEAAAGATPFEVLFLAFSFFIILAAMMLVAALFRLGLERRANELGILAAVGWSRRKIARRALAEGGCLALAGSLLGVPGGIGYAAALIWSLHTWWLAAVSTPFIQLHLELRPPTSLLVGFASGVLVGGGAIWWALWRVRRLAVRALLAGQTSTDHVLPAIPHASSSPPGRAGMVAGLWRHRRMVVEAALLAAAAGLALWAIWGSEQVRAAAFFLSGAFMLAAVLGVMGGRLQAGKTGPAVAPGRGNLVRMALRSAARNPGRSMLASGLVASATFVILAVSVFRVEVAQHAPAPRSGDGGFLLVAESDQPILADLNSSDARRALGFTSEDEDLLKHCAFVAFRARQGDDASCLNLYRPRQPRVLGVPHSLRKRGGFAWADLPRGCENPWELLAPPSVKDSAEHSAEQAAVDSTERIAAERSAEQLGQRTALGSAEQNSALRGPLPVILEKNTANYSLHLWKGRGEQMLIEDQWGRKAPLEIAALLAASVFQGDLLISEEDFLHLFPDQSGYRFFLIAGPPEAAPRLRQRLEEVLGDYGLATETTAERLAAFFAVQNTYLSTFQGLGGLGLLLGTLGLAAVQLRNVLERRKELAALRALGFRRALLAQLVLLENAAVLLLGLGTGGLAAAVAVLPHYATTTVSVPWKTLGALIAAILGTGVLASLAAARAALATPVLSTLRQEN